MVAWAFWNLFLAALPVAFAVPLARRLSSPRASSRIALAGLASVWLLFLPNATYLVTEWRHFLFDSQWRQLTAHGATSRDAMFASAAWALAFAACGMAGLLLFTLAVRPVHRALSSRGFPVRALAPALFLLCSLGTYLGLIYRLNSWQGLSNPGRVLHAVADTLSRPRSVLAIVVFAAVLAASYVGLGIWVDRGTEWLRGVRARRASASGRDT